MRLQLPTRFFVAWLVVGHGAGAAAQDAIPLSFERRAESHFSPERRGAAAPIDQSAPHEAVQPSAAGRDPEHLSKAPPSPIAERPGALCPSPDARWIEGYWEWDKSRRDFAWVTGTWLVPPPGKFWVNGYWRRDARGWYRVPGFWSGGGHVQVQKDRRAQEPASDWRQAGLPLIRPEESIGMAPGPDFFYIPGEYIPAVGGVVWRQGFWAQSQPGWEWIPARWDRRANGWVFREGFWNRVPDATNPHPGDRTGVSGTALVSTSANPMTPTRLSQLGAAQLASRAETDQKSGEAARSSQDAGKPTQTGPSQQPSDAQSGPQQVAAQQPAYRSYAPQPAYYPGRTMMWNARSVVGGFLRQFIP
jgi:hypothetical protein